MGETGSSTVGCSCGCHHCFDGCRFRTRTVLTNQTHHARDFFHFNQNIIPCMTATGIGLGEETKVYCPLRSMPAVSLFLPIKRSPGTPYFSEYFSVSHSALHRHFFHELLGCTSWPLFYRSAPTMCMHRNKSDTLPPFLAVKTPATGTKNSPH